MWVLTLLRRLWAGPQSDRCMSDGTVSGPTAPCVARSVAATVLSVGVAVVSSLSILGPSARILRAKRCIGGLVYRFGALRAPLAAALFVLSLLISLASAAQAQTATTLVSNSEKSPESTTNLELATPFTTGSTAASYTISQVNIRLGPNSDRTLSVAIRENGNNNRPGDLVAKLGNPTTRTNNALNTFTAPAGTQLLANTTYWLVFNDGRASNRTQNPTVGVTQADGQSGGTGWSIGDGSRIKPDGSTGFPDSDPASMIFQINGQADTTAVYRIRSSPVNIVEGGPDNRCSFRRDSGTALVPSLNYEITETGDMLNPARKGKFSRALSSSQQSLSHVTNHRLQTVDDNTDELSSTVTCKLLPGTGYTIGSTGQQSFVVEDNDPTTVSLARIGSGSIEEGETVEFTVTLSRALVAGEELDAILIYSDDSFGVTEVTLEDWSLALKAGDGLNTGVTMGSVGSTITTVSFSGAGSQTATLVLTAVQDVVSESTETITFAMVPRTSLSWRNNLDDGVIAAAGANTFNLSITNVVPDVGLSVSPGTVAEDGGATAIEVTAALSGGAVFPEAQTLTVAVGDNSDSATEGTDYATVADQTITIAAGDSSGTVTFTLTPTDDSVSEGVEDIRLTPTVAGMPDAFTLTGTTIDLTDDDALPVTLVLDPASIDESGDANSATVTATLTGDVSEQDIVLSVEADPGADTVAADYTFARAELLIPAGQSSSTGTVTITAVDNAVDAANKAVTVSATVSGGNGVVNEDVTLAIVDDDPTIVSLARTDSGGIDEGETAEFTVTLGRALVAGEMIDVPLAIGGTGVTTEDWSLALKSGQGLNTGVTLTGAGTATPQVAFSGAGSQTATLVLTAVRDEVSESAETFTVALGPDGNGANGFDRTSLNTNVGGGANPHATNKTFDVNVSNVALPTGVTLSVSPGRVAEDGGATEIEVTAALTGGTTFTEAKTVTVAVGAASDSATEATDYAAVADQTITIGAGESSGTVTFTLTPTDDSVSEGDEEISLTPTVASVPDAFGLTPVVITLFDDAPTGSVSLSVTRLSVSEVSGASQTTTYKVELDQAPTEDVTITVTSGDTDAATVDTDTSRDGLQSTLTFTSTNWDTPQEVTVTGVDDGVAQTSPRRVTISHSATSSDRNYNSIDIDNVAVSVSNAAIPVVGFTGSSVAISEGNEGTVTLTRTGDTSSALTVLLEIVQNKEPAIFLAALDSSQTGRQQVTIPAGESSVEYGLQTVGDKVVEPIDFYLITILAADTYQRGDVPTTFLIVNDDDEVPTGVELSVSPGTVAEDGGATEIEVTAALSGDTAFGEAKTVTVAVGAGSDSATEGTDYATVADQTITIGAGESSGTVIFTLTPRQDTTSEGDEAISLTPTVAGVAETFGLTPATIDLTDDEALPVVALALSPASIDESGASNSATVTAMLTGVVSSEDIVLTVAAAPGTNAEAADYRLAGTTLTIPAGQSTSTGTVTITAVDNAVDAANKAVTVSATVSGGNGVAAPEDVTLTITDDDDAGVTVTPTSVRVTEASGAGNTATYEVVLDRAPTADVTITVTSGDTDAATVDTDTITSGLQSTLTFTSSNWETAQEVTITGVDDNVDQNPDRTLTISHSAASSDTDYNAINIADVAVTVVDDDGGPTIAIDSMSIAEGQTKTFTVTNVPSGWGRPEVSNDVDAEDTAAFATACATAGTNNDVCVLNPRDATWNPTSRTFVFTLRADLDGVAEETETFTLVLVDSSEARTPPVSFEMQVLNTPLSVISIDTPSVVEGADDTTVSLEFSVTLDRASPQEITVDFADTTTGTATSATDYATVSTGTLTFAAGETSKTISVSVNGDDIDESNETIILRLSNATGATLSGGSSTLVGTGTITDDDAAPTGVTLSVDPGTVAENGGATPFEVTAALSGGTTFDEAKTVTVAVGAASDSATEGTDYATVGDQTITIGAGESTGTVTFTLTPMQDTTSEGVEVISLTPTVAGVAETFGLTPATIDLTDDEALPVVALALSPASIDESGASNSATVTATLTGAVSDQAIVLTVAAAPGADTEAADYRLAGTTLTIPAGQSTSTGTVTITAVDNAVDAANKAVTVSATVSGGNGVAAPEDVTLTITDDDAAPTGVTLSVDPGTVAENGGATPFEVTAALSGGTTFDEAKTVTVAVGAASDSATEATDYTAVDDQTITIGAGESTGTVTFTLIPMQDTTSEGDEAISLTPTVAGVAETFGLTPATIDLTDDEALPVVALALSPASIDESGASNSATVTATLTGAVSSEAIVLTVAAAPGADTEAADYRLAGTTLTIPAGQSTSTGTVTITAVDNAVDAANKAVTVSATVSGGNGVANPEDATLTIVDDDAAGVLVSETELTVTEASGAGNTATYEVVLDSAPSANVTITVISGDTDAATVSTANRQGTLVFTSGNWNIGQEVTVTGVDDSVNQSADRALTIRHRATSSDTNYHTIAIASVAVTIIDDDDADLADQVVRPALTRFGRTVGEQVLGAVTDRLGDNRRPGFEGRLAGEALPRVTPEPDDWQQSCSKLRPCTRPQVVPDRKDGHRPAGEGGVGAVPAEDIQTWRPGDRRVREDESVTRGVTEDDLITSTAFALTAETEADTSVALWGRGAQSGFSGSAGSLDVDGEVTSFMVGADWERNSRLFGMMLSQSRGRIDYTLDDVSGEIEANLTALVPYAGWQVTDHLRAWGVMGLGSGDMILTPEADSGRLKTDIDWYMAAGGVTGDLRSVDALEGARLQWSADALWTRTTSEAVPGLSASAGATTRLRIGLESQWERILPSGATLTPRLDVGLRYDAGDAETGFGLGVGGGVDFFDPAHNLLLSLEGRTLVLHEAEALENWGLGFTMSYDPRPETKRGFTARVTQNFGGASSGGAATLLSPMVFPEAQKAESGGAWSLEAAYGMNRGRGMVGSTYSTLTGKSSIEGARLGFRTEPDAGHAKDITMDLWTDPAQKDAGASLNYRW